MRETVRTEGTRKDSRHTDGSASKHYYTQAIAVMRRGLTLGYVGSVEQRRGFPRLIEIVKNLRSEGFPVDLVINGNKPENIDLSDYPWVRLYERQPLESLAELLRSVDVGVIPYVDKEYWGLLSITKMATYMAAGLPILSLQLTETSNILAKWDCGISVDDWDGFVAAVKTLCQDKSLRERLGKKTPAGQQSKNTIGGDSRKRFGGTYRRADELAKVWTSWSICTSLRAYEETGN